MIIARRQDGTYITDTGSSVLKKEDYEKQLNEIQSLKQPTDRELIEFAKQFHEYYIKDITIKNLQNNIKEINEFEKNKDKLVLEDK